MHLYKASKLSRTIRDHLDAPVLFRTPLLFNYLSSFPFNLSLLSFDHSLGALFLLSAWTHQDRSSASPPQLVSFFSNLDILHNPLSGTSKARSSMQPTSMPFSPIKDGRRILGEKDTNACLSPAHQSKQSVSVTGTPVKRTLFTNASPKKLLPSPVFAGQKRTREQLDETDVNNGHVQEPRGLENQSSQSTVNHDAQQVSCILTARKLCCILEKAIG